MIVLSSFLVCTQLSTSRFLGFWIVFHRSLNLFSCHDVIRWEFARWSSRKNAISSDINYLFHVSLRDSHTKFRHRGFRQAACHRFKCDVSIDFLIGRQTPTNRRWISCSVSSSADPFPSILRLQVLPQIPMLFLAAGNVHCASVHRKVQLHV